MKKYIPLAAAVAALVLLQSCLLKVKTIQDGEIGVKQRFGKVKPAPVKSGFKVYGMGTRIFKIDGNIRTTTVKVDARTSDGVLVHPKITLSYQVIREKAPDLLVKYGKEVARGGSMYPHKLSYESRFVIPTTESELGEYIGRQNAEGLYNIKREQMVTDLTNVLTPILEEEGIRLERISLKAVGLDGKYRNLLTENALYEQQSKNLDYRISLAAKQNELHLLNAQGDSSRNETLGGTLSPAILEEKRIDANREIGTTPGNRTVIIQNQQ